MQESADKLNATFSGLKDVYVVYVYRLVEMFIVCISFSVAKSIAASGLWLLLPSKGYGVNLFLIFFFFLQF
jgi:hypothetical protein